MSSYWTNLERTLDAEVEATHSSAEVQQPIAVLVPFLELGVRALIGVGRELVNASLSLDGLRQELLLVREALDEAEGGDK